MNAMTKRRPAFFDWRAGLFWCGPVLVAVGFFAERMWRFFPAPRAVETLVIAAFATSAGFLLSRLFRAAMASTIAIIFLVALVFFAGVLPIIAAAFLAAAAVSIGGLISARNDGATLIVGLAVISGALGWLLPFPLHYRFVYFLALWVPIAFGWRHVTATTRSFAGTWRQAVADSPRLAAFTVLVIGLASVGCWLPTVQYDDLAYHLGLPSQLATLHYYRMDVQSQFWALAPWSADIVQAVAQVLSGKESRGAIDAMWLIGIAALVWNLTMRVGASTSIRWIATALVASQPLLAALLGGMQAELPSTAAILALATTVSTSRSTPNRDDVMCFALIAAFLIASKTGFLAIVVPMTVWLALRWRGQWNLRLPLLGVAIFFAATASSYVYAALVTSNPLFPLLATWFPSSFPPGAIVDTRWAAPVNLLIPWQLTFHTADYLEGWNGAAGFSMLGLLGATVVACIARPSRAMTICAAIAFIAAITTVHYFRYVFPALVLITPVAVVAASHAIRERTLIAVCIVFVAMNLLFQSCAYWTLHVGGVKLRILSSEEATMERFVPERSLLQLARERNTNANVMLCSPNAPFGAELAGRGFVAAHYDPSLESARLIADGDPTGVAWRALFDRADATFAIVSTSVPANPALSAALADAHMIAAAGSAQLWELTRERGDDALYQERDSARARFRP